MKTFVQTIVLLGGMTLAWAGLLPTHRLATAHAAVARPDTFIIRTDTLIDQIMVKDSAYRRIFRRDTTSRAGLPDTSRKAQPVVVVDSTVMALPEIRVADLSGMDVCAGSPVVVPFTTIGRFNPDNQFLLLQTNSTGRVDTLGRLAISNSVQPYLISGQVPTVRSEGYYQLRMAATSPAVSVSVSGFRVLTTPTARIDLPDGSSTTTILPGQPVTVRVSLTGQGPWTFTLNDGTRVVNTLSTPYELTLTPTKPTGYKVLTVSGPCGSGHGGGAVLVNVNENPVPAIALKAPAGGYLICTGTPFQVAFSATGCFQTGNGFVAQLADSTGNWTTISPSVLSSPATARLPYGISPGRPYRLRVTATLPVLSSDSAQLMVASQAIARLRADTIRVEENKSADLTVDFDGGGPWFVLLTDGTYENGITKTPHTIRVSPANSTGYGITSAGGACGVGEYGGRTFVRVNILPSTIATGNLSARTVCVGTEIVVPFTTTGRFYADNKWVVQVADTSGRFMNMPTTYKDGVLRTTVNPGPLRDTLNTIRLRVVSTLPVVQGSETELKVVMPNAAQASVIGEATIRPGQTAKVRVSFRNGLPPWSFMLSDGAQVTGTFLNPYVLTVAPKTTTEYSVPMLSSACGRGLASGRAVVTVDQ